MSAVAAFDQKRILLFLFEQPALSQALARTLANVAMVRAVHVSELEKFNPVAAVAIVCDFDLSSGRSFRAVQAELARPAYRNIPRVVVTDRALGIVEAGALNATETMSRHLGPEKILARFRSLFASSFELNIAKLDTALQSGLSSAHAAASKIFEGIPSGIPLMLEDVAEQEEPTIEAIRVASLRGWLEAVRHHHSQSYRHCLSVTGIAVSFAQQLGMHHDDQRRVARAAIVHDVGKAHIPLAILDKPGKLTEEETSAVREHARLGHDTLLQGPDAFPFETLDAVLHHHELLDGSGYPNGLAGRDVSDLVRLITMSDIFSALIEERPYKAPLSRPRAYDVMLGMEGKLDADLLRAFQAVALHN
jgi:HD-GYP domain-containing protein (c-di-GMP phosphodiesterase class II)